MARTKDTDTDKDLDAPGQNSPQPEVAADGDRDPEAGDPEAPAEKTPKVINDEDAPKRKGLLAGFYSLSGYTSKDVLSFNEDRRTVVTKNGSKYQVSKSGKQLKVLSGALPPNAEE